MSNGADEKRVQKYVNNGGNCCPQCEATDLEGTFVEVQSGSAYQRVSCNDCGAAWTDTYTLTGFIDLELEE
jgi:hypothetical protein